MNRLSFDPEEDQWKFQPLVQSESKSSQMKKRPSSAVGYKRPITASARVAMTRGPRPRYRAENVMLLELDMNPLNISSPDRFSETDQTDQTQSPSPPQDSSPSKDSAVHKSDSWCQSQKSLKSSPSNGSLAACPTPAVAQ
ncbi:unnamed protein product [Knipowitschia caucasica]